MSTSATLHEMFDKMLSHFGPRNWWPGETPFEVMVGAILTQNTNWKNVEKAIINLKNADALNPKKMLSMHDMSLASLIRPAGFFKLKTKRLKNFLKYFVEEYDADVSRMKQKTVDELREELLSINGIGRETADSILLYALNKPIFVIDSYTKRILLRHNVCDEDADYNDLQELFMDNLPEDVKHFNEYHALIVEVGKEYCRKTPKCDSCPLKDLL